jgi:hypothetical protein
MSASLALAACSGSDGDGDSVADAPTQTVTVTETVGAPELDSEERRSGEATPKESSPSPDQENERKAQTSPKPSGGAATGDSSPEFTLAVIDAESASVRRRRVRRYAVLLDRLEEGCEEARAELAEAALTTSHDVETTTKAKLSILDVLREVAASRPSGVCRDAFDRVREKHT